MKMKFFSLAICASLILSSCNLSNTAKGGMYGGAGGGALGALIGGLIGDGKGAAIGAAVGTAVGAGTGVAIGHRMDKAKKEAEKIAAAKAEMLTDAQGLNYVKVTFDAGILFPSSKATLNAEAKKSLDQFATKVLAENADMDVAIVGFTDNDPWRNSTAEESKAKNLKLSEDRAMSVSDYLKAQGAPAGRIKHVVGKGEEHPVADNATAAGKRENRRVEVYLLPSQDMINNLNQQN